MLPIKWIVNFELKMNNKKVKLGLNNQYIYIYIYIYIYNSHDYLLKKHQTVVFLNKLPVFNNHLRQLLWWSHKTGLRTHTHTHIYILLLLLPWQHEPLCIWLAAGIYDILFIKLWQCVAQSRHSICANLTHCCTITAHLWHICPIRLSIRSACST